MPACHLIKRSKADAAEILDIRTNLKYKTLCGYAIQLMRIA